MYANIIVDITHEKLDKTFQYRIPPHLEGELSVGMEVLVPFGRGNRETKGYVTGISDTCVYDESKVKEIQDISRNSVAIEGKLAALAAWMKEQYGGTMIQALKTVLPIKQKENARVKKWIRLLLDEKEGKQKLDHYLEKNQKARARLMAALLDDSVLDYGLAAKKLNITLTVIRALEEQGILVLESEQVYRNPVKGEQAESNILLTDEQKHVISTFWEDYKKEKRGTYLIYGVTGSGKTEVYIEMIRRVAAQGKQAIVLIPEIALTYQTVMRFYRNFGDRVSIMNSRLSAGERYDQMLRAKEGGIDVMIGPRSALFTPFPNLGLIVIDEEHETTYKSEQVPRYHARETAEARAEMEGASVVLGSATPSLEAMYRAKNGEYTLLELKNRSGMQDMAQVYTVDLREELKEGNRSILSRKLQELIADRLEKKEQIMLFLNRRGYAGFISCRECGHVAKCPHCDVSLSSHRGGRMVCHYCGYEKPKEAACPACGSRHIGEFRAGTQQIEETVKKQFPGARVLRMDMDTTRQKDGHEKILAAFANEEADILVGTQMIVKGHDFPNVTLVGVLAADMSLYTDDYRAGERTFQLLTQAVGRAGRGYKGGEAVIQTYSPEHYGIVTAAAQDYEVFYEEEISYRKLMGYPPAENLLAVLASCEDEQLLEKGCRYLKEYALRVRRDEDMDIIGPASPGIGKVNDVYRKVLYLKAERYDTLIKMKNYLEQYIEVNSGFQKIRIQFDFNPMQVF
ncbi:replication restart helicase PriA [Faecalicatena contorta]|uniref:Replication restart protein PriA n=1 Tax=Faecalicatena contorta TaxID=39482 RepID=A0A316A0Y2_9FIRM|nr:primosomal protein N' [Faecalicatena contorta]PWJ51596.1 replication restart DNA helicase PriA [Faecalicatena contorta]SUQ13152.1 replication restart DNA helicase PriA [Faecalicatena contorta]